MRVSRPVNGLTSTTHQPTQKLYRRPRHLYLVLKFPMICLGLTFHLLPQRRGLDILRWTTLLLTGCRFGLFPGHNGFCFQLLAASFGSGVEYERT